VPREKPKLNKVFRRLFRSIGPILWASVCLASFLPEAHGEIIDRVVAIVNKEIITFSELSRMAQLQSAGADPVLSSDQYRQMLQGMIEQKLIDQRALTTEITVSEREVDQFIKKFQEKNKLSTDQLVEALEQQGMPMEEYRSKVREEIRRSQIIGQEVHAQINVTEKELTDYYQAHLDEYVKPPQVKIEQIFFPFSSSPLPGEKESIVQKSEAALEKIRSGGTFEEVAKACELEQGAQCARDLDYFGKGELMGPLDEPAFTLAIGDVSSVIETDKGCFIIKVLDRKEERTTELEEIRQTLTNQILQQKTEQRLHEWLEELHNEAYVEIKI
jgi:peptidyl-prolyl cis-trans isomerase SurA